MKLKKLSAILLLGAMLSTAPRLMAQVPRGPQELQTKQITLNKTAFNQSLSNAVGPTVSFGQHSVIGQTQDKDKYIDVISFSYMGESLCVSKTSGSQNETWVIRFEPVAGKDDRLKLFADRLEKGKRVPLFERSGGVKKLGSGLLILKSDNSYSLVLDPKQSLTGTFSSSDGTIVRRVKLGTVDAKQLPPAPSPDVYTGVWFLKNARP